MSSIVPVKENQLASTFTRELEKVPSFGGVSLLDNFVRADNAITKLSGTERLWNRAKTEWLWKHTNECNYDDLGNLKQISAEISSKRDALRSAKYGYLKNEIELRKKRAQIADKEMMRDQFKECHPRQDVIQCEIDLLNLEIIETEEGMQSGMKYIEGALKDVLTLETLYDEIMLRVGSFSEEDSEANESRHHIGRCVSQSVRDVREGGRITKGNQEYLEFLGINPTKMEMEIKTYLHDHEIKSDSWDGTALRDFIVQAMDKLNYLSNKRAEVMGFSPDTNFNRSITFSGKLDGEGKITNPNNAITDTHE